jgi:hypothetical protein
LKNILLKGVMLAVLLVFLFKGGMRLLLVGWRLFVPVLVVTILYFVVRNVMQKKKLAKREDADALGSGQPIMICPHCHQPKGSCPKCRE